MDEKSRHHLNDRNNDIGVDAYQLNYDEEHHNHANVEREVQNNQFYENKGYHYDDYPSRMRQTSRPKNSRQTYSDLGYHEHEVDYFPQQQYRQNSYDRNSYQNSYESTSEQRNIYSPKNEPYIEQDWKLSMNRHFTSEFGQNYQFPQRYIPQQSYQNRFHQHYNQREQYHDKSNEFTPQIYRPDNQGHHQYYDHTMRTQSRASSTSMSSHPHSRLGSFESMISSQSSLESLANRPLIKEINDNDVLCGRGGATNVHIGNRHFRSIVKQHQKEYLSAKKKDKPIVAAKIVSMIRNKKPPGRFLKKNSHRNAWYEIGDVKAKEKTSQALREGAPVMRLTKQSSTSRLHHTIDTDNSIESCNRLPLEKSDRDETSPSDEQNRGAHLEFHEENNNPASNKEYEQPKKLQRVNSFSETRRNFEVESCQPLSLEEQRLKAIFDPPRAKIPTKSPTG